MPLGAGLFLLTMIAEVERVPFDMPEAEAELVEGWWTEYGGMRFGMLFMAEYIRTYAACFLFTHFFLGGWHLPFQGLISQIPLLGDLYLLIPGAIVVLLKSWLVFLLVFVWARFSLARIRTDQILEFGWRILLPLAVLQVDSCGSVSSIPFRPNRNEGHCRRWLGMGCFGHTDVCADYNNPSLVGNFRIIPQ